MGEAAAMGFDVCVMCGGDRWRHEEANANDYQACPSPHRTAAHRVAGFRPSTAPVVAGLGADAPTVTNAAGGKQSHTPYRCDLLPPHAVLAVAEVLAHGAAKYGPNNWHKITVGEHLNHALGHLLAYLAGDTSDAHLDHAACRVLFALDQRKSGREGGAA